MGASAQVSRQPNGGLASPFPSINALRAGSVHAANPVPGWDGRSACIRIDPETVRHGSKVVMDVARERQEAGEIPDGTILSVKQVR